MICLHRCLKEWFNFLKYEIDNKTISPAVMRPNQHLLSHVPFMIEQMGVLRSFSCRALERTIQLYKKRIRSRVFVDENIANVLMRMNFQNNMKTLTWNPDNQLNLLCPRPYDKDSYLNHMEDENSQLWAPRISCNIFSFPFNVTASSFLVALRRYCLREPSMSKLDLKNAINEKSIEIMEIFGRAWLNAQVYKSVMYSKSINESRRNNTFLKFDAVSLK